MDSAFRPDNRQITCTDRVRRHRANMKAQGCKRIDITIGGDVEGDMRNLAQKHGLPFWRIVEMACERYVDDSGNADRIEKQSG